MLISVVMSAYNEEKNIGRAIESILNQTYKDFEFIIVNDGSTDATENIIKSYKDSRIIQLNKTNTGLVDSLVAGIERAAGKYIARMDADDICDPLRLEKEVLFLDKNQDVALVGTWCKIVNRDKIIELRLPTKDRDIRRFMLRDSPFVHPSVMFRLDAYKAVGGYNRDLKYAEDFELWIRLASHYKVANIPEFLVNRYENDNLRTRPLYKNLTRYDIYKTRFEIQLKACRLIGLTPEAPLYLLKTSLSMLFCKLFSKR